MTAVRSDADVRILAVSGSLRTRSSNTILLRAAAVLAPVGAHVELFEGLDALPHFNPDLDGPDALPAVRTLREAVARADAVLISSPEYAHGVPGVLKNALDWLVSGVEIVQKPIALLNAARRATHAQASLAETLRTMSADVVADASRTVSLAGRAWDVADIVSDASLAAELRAALEALTRVARDRRRETTRL